MKNKFLQLLFCNIHYESSIDTTYYKKQTPYHLVAIDEQVKQEETIFYQHPNWNNFFLKTSMYLLGNIISNIVFIKYKFNLCYITNLANYLFSFHYTNGILHYHPRILTNFYLVFKLFGISNQEFINFYNVILKKTLEQNGLPVTGISDSQDVFRTMLTNESIEYSENKTEKRCTITLQQKCAIIQKY